MTVPHLGDWIRVVHVKGVQEGEKIARKMIAGDVDAMDGFVIDLGAGSSKL